MEFRYLPLKCVQIYRNELGESIEFEMPNRHGIMLEKGVYKTLGKRK